MRKLFCILVTFLFVTTAFSKDLLHSIPQSPYTYYYKITNREAFLLYSGNKRADKFKMLHSKVDSALTVTNKLPKLASGHYLVVKSQDNRIEFELYTKQNFHSYLLQNGQDFSVRVIDTLGNPIPTAKVWAGCQKIKFNKKTQTFYLPLEHIKGLMVVEVDGLRIYQKLKNDQEQYTKVGRYIDHYFKRTGRFWKDTWYSLVEWDSQGEFRQYKRRWVRRLDRWFDNDNRSRNRAQKQMNNYRRGGYVVLNKPKYMPGDTVKVKAYLYKWRSKKLLNRKLDLYLSNSNSYYAKPIKKLSTLEPYAKGGYAYEFVLDDSLDAEMDLDRNYYLMFSKPGHFFKQYKTGEFRFEDYELNPTSLNVRLSAEQIFKDDTLNVYIKGANDNGFNLQDARIKVRLTINYVHDYYNRSTFIPNKVLFEQELPLEPVGETKLQIPSNIFPAANMQCNLEVEMLTSDNERRNERKYISYSYGKRELKKNLSADTLHLSYLENNKELVVPAKILVYGPHNNVLEVLQKDLPCAIKVNPYVKSYSVILPDYTQTVDMNGFMPDVNFMGDRSWNQVKLKVQNECDLHFNYFIYKGNKLVKKGFDNSLDLTIKDRSKKPYFACIQYMWAGTFQEENYSIPLKPVNELDITVKQPEQIYPGMKTKIDLQVTQNGKPVKDVDLTAYGLTNKFEVSKPRFFDSSVRNWYRDQYNDYALRDFTYKKESNLLNQYKTLFANLDTVEYYRFLYPEKGYYFYSYDTSDTLTQFAPFVVKNGAMQPVYAIWVDSKPIYIDLGTQKQNYSFSITPGWHQIELRTDTQRITIVTDKFEAKKKTIISVDAEHSEPSFRKACKMELSSSEQQGLYPFLFAVRNNFKDKYAYLKQDDQVYLLNDGSQRNYYYSNQQQLVSSVSPREVKLIQEDGKQIVFDHEPNFEYDFSDTLKIKMRSVDYAKQFRYFQNHSKHSLNEEVLTETKLLQAFKDQESQYYRNRRMEHDRYEVSRKTNTDATHGELRTRINFESIRNPLNWILFKQNDSVLWNVYRGNDKDFYNLEPGSYKLMALFDEGDFALIDSIDIKADGYTVLKMNNVPISKANAKSLFYHNEMEKNVRILYPGLVRLNGEILMLQGKEWKGPAYMPIELFDSKSNPSRILDATYTGNSVRGIIRDEVGEPIIGATVKIKNTNQGTITDFNGEYILKNLPKGKFILVFSYVGMETVEFNMTPNASSSERFDIVLKNVELAMDEVVVCGYGGAVMKKDLVASISTISYSSGGKKMKTKAVKNEPMYSAIEYNSFTEEAKPLDFSLPEPDAAFIEESMTNSTMRTRFSDYAYWQPKLRTDKKGNASFNVTYPDDVTNWKTFVFAAKGARKFGSYEANLKSYKPLMGQLNVPRFLLQGDSSTVIGKSINYLGDTANVTTSFSVNGVTQGLKSKQLIYGSTDSLMLSPQTEDSLSVAYKIEKAGFFDGENRKIPVFPVGLEETKGVFCMLDTDTTFTISLPLGKKPIYMESNELSVLLSEMQHLFDYEHLCNEQMASKLKAYLYYDKVCRYMKKPFHYKTEVETLLKKLSKNQNEEGKWGWWNKSNTSDWITIHVTEAFLLAKSLGYQVKTDLKYALNPVEVFMVELERGGNPNGKLKILENLIKENVVIDYKMYIQDIDSMLLIQKYYKLQNLTSAPYRFSTEEKLRLILLKQKAGVSYNTDILKSLEKKTLFGNVYYTDDNDRYYRYYSYWSHDVNITLLAYQILKQQGGHDAQIRKIRNWFYEKRNVNGWTNTYESAKIIDVLLPDILHADSILTPVIVKLGGPINQTVTSFPFVMQTTATDFTVSKTGTAPVFFTCFQKNWNPAPKAKSGDFAIDTKFAHGSNVLVGGKAIQLKVDIKVFKDAEYTMIEIPIPGGCSYESKNQSYFNYEEHREFFKNKVVIYCRNLPRGMHDFTINLLPRYTGTYTLNPAKVELMYFPTFNANNEIKRVKIK